MRFKKEKLIKRIMAFFMAVLMTLTFLPESGYAVLAAENEQAAEEEEKTDGCSVEGTNGYEWRRAGTVHRKAA